MQTKEAIRHLHPDTIRDELVDIVIGYEPKQKSKYKFIQNIYNKLFVYKVITKKAKVKKIEIKSDDIPLPTEKYAGDILIKV